MEDIVIFDLPEHEDETGYSLEILTEIKFRALSEWGSGWPRCQGDKQKTITTKRGLRITCRAEISELVGLLLDKTEEMGYDVRQDDTGAFVCRPIGGTQTASNHSWGLAIDINWLKNGFGYDVPHDIPDSIANMWKKYGFSWGGDWSGKKDWMHFEWKRTKAEAASFTERARKELNKLPDKPPEVHPVTGSRRVGIAWTPSGKGYLVLFEDGGTANYGDAPIGTSTAGVEPAGIKATSIAIHPEGKGAAILYENGQIHTRHAPHLGEPAL